MKIEDEVFHKFNVEMEHILVTRRENKGNQEQDPNSSGANLDTTAESIPLEINELEQPEEFVEWSTPKRERWFRGAFEKLLPVNLNLETKLIPFKKLLKIYKVLQPQIKTGSVEHRRNLYKAKNWQDYNNHAKNELKRSTEIAATGFKILNEVIGLQQNDLQRSMIQYSSDFDKRDIIESTLMQTSKEIGRCLTKEKVLASLKYLNDN